MKAIWKNKIIAESDDTLVIENNHYLPHNSVKKEFLQISLTTTECPWKAAANYFGIVVEGETNQYATWYYKETKEDSIKRVAQCNNCKGDFANYIAFGRGVEIVE
jgi:uncharacterized protein (DUF427 family)